MHCAYNEIYMENAKKCKYCKNDLNESWFYCPTCGKGTMEKPPSTSIMKQILIYVVSFCFAPFGLGWAIQYMRSSDKKAKVVGLISLLLTILALLLTAWSVYTVMRYYSTMLDGLSRGKYPY